MSKLSRRDFLRTSLLAGSGLVLGLRLPADTPSQPAVVDYDLAPRNMARRQTNGFAPNAYLHIAPDNTITITVHRSEMGQGVNTAIPMIIAEELEVDPAVIQYVQAPPDRTYGDQVTGGSVSISGSYSVLRVAGATGKTMLITAAAQIWGVDAATCRAANGSVIHDASGQALTYGELAETAATLPVPKGKEVPLKDPAQFTLIGTPQPLRDGPDIVTGKAIYASDLKLPGMLVAVVARCPVFGGKPASHDPSAALAVPGVRQVVEISTGIAVVAGDTWSALKGRDALQITWDEGRNADLSTAAMRDEILAKVKPPEEGKLQAVYEIPYLAHVPMEPMTCVADATNGKCEVWAPTQDRQTAQRAAAGYSRVSQKDVIIHVPLIGGAFGRRLQVDYVQEAVEISKAIQAPVKVFWTRADDVQHDYYHPFQITQMTSSLELGAFGGMRQLGTGHGVPTGAWRSVENHPEAFFRGSFNDELAAALGADPLEAQLAAYAGGPLEEVLRLAADKAGWGNPLPAGWGRGIAAFSTFSVTHVAQVVEVSVENGQVRVQRVVCAVNCGRVVNPDAVKAQMEGGIVFGLSAALYGEIILEGGRVLQSNFHDYPIMRLDVCPAIEVYLVESDKGPTGTGEMGVPPVAPALMNAIFAATGKRIRRFPVSAESF